MRLCVGEIARLNGGEVVLPNKHQDGIRMVFWDRKCIWTYDLTMAQFELLQNALMDKDAWDFYGVWLDRNAQHFIGFCPPIFKEFGSKIARWKEPGAQLAAKLGCLPAPIATKIADWMIHHPTTIVQFCKELQADLNQMKEE